MKHMFSLLIIALLSFGCSDENSASPDENKNDIISDIPNIRSVSFLALGDSYSIGQSVAEDERWPNQLKYQNNLKNDSIKIDEVKIIAKTGWTTQELNSALSLANISTKYNLVSLLIGVNNQYRRYPIEEYPSEFKALLNTAIYYAGGNKNHVFVVSIPDYGYTPFGESNQEKISADIDAYNDINKSIAEEYGVNYYDITPISRRGLANPDLVASDNLHPSGKQYTLWVEKIIADKNFHQLLTK